MNLRLSLISVSNALRLALAQQCVGVDRGVDLVFDEHGARLLPSRSDEQDDRSEEIKRARARRSVLAWAEGDSSADADDEKLEDALETVRVRLAFERRPVDDVLASLEEATAFSFTADANLDTSRAIDVTLDNVPLGEALSRIERAVGPDARFEIRCQAYHLANAGAAGEPSLHVAPARRRISLALFRGTIPDLVAALEREHVYVVLDESTWESRGELSLWLDQVTVREAAAAISARTPLRAEYMGQDGIVIRGSLPGARGGLEAQVPAGLPPTAGTLVHERRVRLARWLADRRAATAEPVLDRARFLEIEAAILRESANLDRLVTKLAEVARAHDRVVALRLTARAAASRAAATRARADLQGAERDAIREEPGGPSEDPAARDGKLGEATVALTLALTEADLAAEEAKELEAKLASAEQDLAILERLERGAAPAQALAP